MDDGIQLTHFKPLRIVLVDFISTRNYLTKVQF